MNRGGEQLNMSLKSMYTVVSLILLILLVIPLVTIVSAQTKIQDVRLGPYIDKITMPVARDYNVRLMAFIANEYDLVGVLPADLDRVRSQRPDAHIIFTVV
jgi:hypothetical protein